jgi:LysM repeat protein
MPHESKHASKHALGVVAGAAIPAAVIGSLALAPAAQAAPTTVPNTSGSFAKAVTPETIKVAEDQIKAHLIASRVSTLGLPAKRDVSEIKIPAGASLWSIAQEYDTTVSALKKLNNLKSDSVIAGKTLKVSGKASKSTTKSSSSTSATYTVKNGDTLGGIANKHDMSLSDLLSKNDISASKVIFPGNKLKVKGSASSSSNSSKSQKTSSSSGSSSYTVKNGDTLGSIAIKHNMSLSSLLKANDISASKPIFPGSKIKVSGGSSSSSSSSKSTAKPKAKTSTYTVKSGDTLSGIATSHDMKLASLLNLNPDYSASSPLKIGAKLKVSGSSVAPSGQVKKQKIGNTFAGRTYADHVVKDANSNKDYLDSTSVPSRGEMQALIRSTAKSMGVDPALALAHAYQESGFNMRAVSPANAVGAMQVLPSTGDWIASVIGQDLNVLNPRDNVVAGVAVIAYNLDNTDNLDDAIASYYQGLAGVRNNGMYEDTKHYVASIKAHMKNYR